MNFADLDDSEKQQIVDELSSGLSRLAVALNHGIKYHQFCRWCRVYQDFALAISMAKFNRRAN